MARITTPEPQSHAQWRAYMQERIATCPQDASQFWLVNTLADTRLPGILWNLEPMPRAWPLYMSSYYDEVVNSGPFLVVCKPDSAIADWLLDRSEHSPVASLIQVDKTAGNEVFDHLQNLLECIHQNEASLFRYYDPRCLYGIQTSDDARNIRRVLGPICFLDSWEHGRKVPIRLGTGLDSGFRCDGPLTYPDDFLEHIWDENQIHALVQQVGARFSDYGAADFDHKYRLVEATYAFLSRHGFDDRYSLIYGACVAAFHGSDVWERAAVAAAFDRNADLPLVEILTPLGLG